MRLILLMAVAATTPAWSQERSPGYDQGGLYEGVFADHSLTPSAGSVRLNPRLGATTPQDTSPQSPPARAADPHPAPVPMKSLEDLARDRRSPN